MHKNGFDSGIPNRMPAEGKTKKRGKRKDYECQQEWWDICATQNGGRDLKPCGSDATRNGLYDPASFRNFIANFGPIPSSSCLKNTNAVSYFSP